MINWGLIGCGKVVTKAVLPSFLVQKTSKLYGVAGKEAKEAEEFVKANSLSIKAYSSVAGLLSDENTGVVYIAVPHHLHKSLTIKALSAGKHVLCEKPLGLNYRECLEMIEAEKKSGKLLGCSYYRRFHPQYKILKDLVESKRLGRLVTVRAHYSGGAAKIEASDPHIWLTRKESGGGALLDIGSHIIDVMLYLGGDVKEVSGRAENILTGWEADDIATAIFKYESGAHGLVVTHFNCKSVSESLDLFFAGGLASYSSIFGDFLKVHTGEAIEEIKFEAVPGKFRDRELINRFTESIQTGKKFIASGKEAAKTNRVIDTIFEK